MLLLHSVLHLRGHAGDAGALTWARRDLAVPLAMAGGGMHERPLRGTDAYSAHLAVGAH